MKYFLPEFDLSDPNLTREERDFKERQWELACKEYDDYMQKNLKIFSKSFLNEYRNGGFHDYRIVKIDFDFTFDKKKREKLNITICLEHNKKYYYFIHEGVINYNASIEDVCGVFLNGYLYGEYYKDKDKLWHHNFLFGSFYDMNITCKKFIYKEDKQ